MSETSFRGDCSRCAGLCCVMLSFDRGPHFAFGKSAGEACGHLTNGHRCAIHDRLAAEGMTGCVRFDCMGAGQLVTEMFDGLTPQTSPAVSRAMSLAFARTREVQTLRRLVRDASPDAELDVSLAEATTSYAALLKLDLGHARRAASAIVRASGRPS